MPADSRAGVTPIKLLHSRDSTTDVTGISTTYQYFWRVRLGQEHQMYYPIDATYRILQKSLESSEFRSGVSTLLRYTVYSMCMMHQIGICLTVCG